MVQFRKSKKAGPFRFTLTNRGLSTSVGAGPLRVSRGSDGKYRRTMRVPGVGIYDTRVIGGEAPRLVPHGQRAAARHTAADTADVRLSDQRWFRIAMAAFAIFVLGGIAVMLYIALLAPAGS